MKIRLTLLILTAALALLATGSTALAADGNAIGRFAQPAASQPDARPGDRPLRPLGRPQGSQPQPRIWRAEGPG